MGMKLLLVILVAVMAAPEDALPDRYKGVAADQLMRMMITKGFAKEKEDNTDKKCGCDCTCCEKRHSQYWVNKEGAATTAKKYAKKHLNLSGEKLDEFMHIKFGEMWEKFDVLNIGRIEVE